MRLEYAQCSCVGGREVNEDSVACVSAPAGLLLVVADGLGGHGRGELASRLLTDVFTREFNACQTEDTAAFLSSAFEAAQEEILQLQQELGAPDKMKTTAVALVVRDNTALWAHCGDSRLYHFHNGQFVARTLDHSVPQALVSAGELQERQIPHHPDRNKLLRVVGVPWNAKRYQLGKPVALAEEHAFLLCSDGFWEHIPVRKMERALRKTPGAKEWLALMKSEVERAARKVNMDNYTAAVVRAVAE